MRSKTMFMSLVLLAVLISTEGHKCMSRRSSRQDRADWGVQEKEGKCQPVRVPIPVVVEGYELLKPNTVMLKRCQSTHGCPMRQCISSKTIQKTIKVECWKFGLKNVQCLEFKTFEHEECACGCEPQMCNNNIQDFIEPMCQCKCKEKIEKECSDLIKMVGSDKMMYYPSTCECACTKKLICAYGEMFDKNMCKCVPTSQMMGKWP